MARQHARAWLTWLEHQNPNEKEIQPPISDQLKNYLEHIWHCDLPLVDVQRAARHVPAFLEHARVAKRDEVLTAAVRSVVPVLRPPRLRGASERQQLESSLEHIAASMTGEELRRFELFRCSLIMLLTTAVKARDLANAKFGDVAVSQRGEQRVAFLQLPAYRVALGDGGRAITHLWQHAQKLKIDIGHSTPICCHLDDHNALRPLAGWTLRKLITACAAAAPTGFGVQAVRAIFNDSRGSQCP